MSLGNGCVHVGIVIHEFMHAAGFWHEQSRMDRDKYIRVHESNIIRGMESNFQKMTPSQMDMMGTPYDPCSVMHYGKTAFSYNRKPTITTLDPALDRCIGQRKGFSDIDFRKVNEIYKCKGYPRLDGKPVTVTPKPAVVKPTKRPVLKKDHKHCHIGPPLMSVRRIPFGCCQTAQ